MSSISPDVAPDAAPDPEAASPVSVMPVGAAAGDGDAAERVALLLRGRRWVALTGAGCSTESGIPDYRGVGARGRPRTSIQGPEFRRSAAVRQRYWARAALGWDRIRAAAPNAGHLALARLERGGGLAGIITQNVDRLHHAAGSANVVELHGALAEVRCLDCGALEARAAVQARLLDANRGWLGRDVAAAPDGDAELPFEAIDGFQVVACTACDGVLQPNVVFFGDGVPRPIVERSFAMLDAAEVLVVLGTSLAVFSGYRFLLRAVERGTPVVVVNLGPVRGEERAALKIEAATGVVLPRVAAALGV